MRIDCSIFKVRSHFSFSKVIQQKRSFLVYIVWATFLWFHVAFKGDKPKNPECETFRLLPREKEWKMHCKPRASDNSQLVVNIYTPPKENRWNRWFCFALKSFRSLKIIREIRVFRFGFFILSVSCTRLLHVLLWEWM